MTGASLRGESLNIPLLNRLRAAGGEFVALDHLGPDPGRVAGDLDALISFGFAIERHPYRGAAYAGPAERLCPDQIEHELSIRRIGRRIAVWSRVESTNDLAARAAGSTSNDGLVILAEEQTAGRGRRGRAWTAPPRSSILMSVLLFPPRELAPTGPDSVEGCAWLTALGAVATAEVVAAWTGRQVAIKWPNDVRVAGRKIAGILVECPSPRGRTAVIGIGLNVNVDREAMPVGLRDRSTSIRFECGGRLIDRSDVARALIRSLDHWYGVVRSRGRDALTAAWRDQSEHLGQVVRVATPDGPRRGRLVDLDVRLGLTLQREEVDEPRLVRIALAEILALDPDPEFSSNPGGHWTGRSMSS